MMEKNEAISLEHDTTIHTFGGFMLLHIFHLLFVQITNVQPSIMCFYKAVQQQQQKPGHGFLPYGKGTLAWKMYELASLLEET